MKACAIKDFRPITVSFAIQRLYDKLLLHKIYQFTDHFDCNQHANRKGRQGPEAIHTLRRLVEKTILQGKSLAICKLDVEKTFDTLDHNSILRMMMARNMPEQLIRAVLVEYLNCSVNMHLDNRELCNIKVWSPLSALIFSVCC